MTSDEPRRVTARRSYLMCPPEYFTVAYAINPWMRPDQPADAGRAMRQWERLRQVYLDLGHSVAVIDPVPGLPDMVFAANGATTVDATVLGVTYRDTSPDSQSFVRQYHLTYPNLRDTTGEFAHSYGTDELPESFVIDRHGHIVAIRRGEIDQTFLNQAIALAESS